MMNYCKRQDDQQRSIQPILDGVYTSLFPSWQIQRNTIIALDKLGVDMVWTGPTKTHYVDEKYRFRDYGDCLLEVSDVSDSGVTKLGWATDPTKITTAIAYIVVPNRKLYLIDYVKLREVTTQTFQHRRRIAARNPTHTTYNVSVPWQELTEHNVKWTCCAY